MHGLVGERMGGLWVAVSGDDRCGDECVCCIS